MKLKNKRDNNPPHPPKVHLDSSFEKKQHQPKMPVNELACLKLLPGADILDETLRKKLEHAKEVLEEYTKNPFTFTSQVEDNSYVYIIGRWKSRDEHMKKFINSKENKALLKTLEKQVRIEWIAHYDIEEDIPQMTSPIISISRFFIKPGHREPYQATYDSVEEILTEYQEPHQWPQDDDRVHNELPEFNLGHTHGWRVDKEAEEKEEAVLICGWRVVAAHEGLSGDDRYGEWCKIKQHLKGAEIKHAMPIAFKEVDEVMEELAGQGPKRMVGKM